MIVSNSNTKILRRCYNFVEAEALRTRLDAAGILAVIDGAETQLMFTYVPTALGGVKLKVAPEDYDRAVALLADDASKAAVAGPWVCDRCRERNEATFELCWQCQKPRDENDQRAYLAETAEPPGAEPTQPSTDAEPPDIADNNPYRPILLPENDDLSGSDHA
jgi:hypothetical protein